jgi:hypothetical protein
MILTIKWTLYHFRGYSHQASPPPSRSGIAIDTTQGLPSRDVCADSAFGQLYWPEIAISADFWALASGV